MTSRLPFTGLPRAAWERLLHIAFLTVFGLCYAALAVAAWRFPWGTDTVAFWSAARLLVENGDPYFYPHLQATADPDLRVHLAFPWIALPFVPLAALPLEAARKVWLTINLALLAVAAVSLARLCRPHLPPWGASGIALLLLWLSVRCIEAGQLGILVLVAVLAGIHSLRAGHPFRAGLWFVVTLLKPSIAAGALLAVLLLTLTRRRWGFAAGYGGGALALIGLSTAITPHWFAVYRTLDFSLMVGIKEDGVFVVYWPLATIFDYAAFVLGWTVTPAVAAALALAVALAAASLGGLALWRWRRGALDDLGLIGTSTLLLFLVLPYVRYYDYVFLGLWVAGVFAGSAAVRMTRRALTACLLLVLAAALLVSFGEHPEPWVYHIPVLMYVATWFALLDQRPPAAAPAPAALAGRGSPA